MDKSRMFGLTALFDTPDQVLHAAGEVAKAGYTKYDVNTPYPVHGMDGAMRLRKTRLGFYSLAFGLLGTISAIVLMSWITLADYPLVIGGKPFWSWPAFVPIAFEVTVLLTCILTVAAMVVIYFKFPNNSHPLHGTAYMKCVSSEGFGICLEAADPLFDEAKARSFLQSLGGKEVTPVYSLQEVVADRPRLFESRFIGLLMLTGVLVSGGTYVGLNVLLYVPPFSWMSAQPKLKAQKPSALFANGIGMRVPVEGTIARGFLPYPYVGRPDSAGKNLRNPLFPTQEVLDRGRERYRTFCSPCHGNFGNGDSRLRGQFPNPPSLHTDKVRNWPDGNIFHVITEGQNIMPSYAAQVPRDDRWAIVHYIRVLQRAQNAKEADLQ
jgi:hypothetical protein